MSQESTAQEITDKLEERLAEIEARIKRLEQFAGVNDFDAHDAPSLHRRVDSLEDWRRAQYQD